jgi:hypothetical protein
MTLASNPDKDRLEHIFGIVPRTEHGLEKREQIVCITIPHQFHCRRTIPSQSRSQHIIRLILVQNVVLYSIH